MKFEHVKTNLNLAFAIHVLKVSFQTLQYILKYYRSNGQRHDSDSPQVDESLESMRENRTMREANEPLIDLNEWLVCLSHCSYQIICSQRKNIINFECIV